MLYSREENAIALNIRVTMDFKLFFTETCGIKKFFKRLARSKGETKLLNHKNSVLSSVWPDEHFSAQVSSLKSDMSHTGLFYKNGEIYNEIQQGNWKNSQIGATKWLIGSLAYSLYFFGHCVPVPWCSRPDCGNRLTVSS